MTMDQNQEKIELLSVDLLDQQRPQVEALKSLARSLGVEFGWHYLLDLTWIIRQLGSIPDQRIIDAGAGTGILQWYLAGQGAQVISVDRLSRAMLPLRFRRRFNVEGLRADSQIDLAPPRQVFKNTLSGKSSLSAKGSVLVKDIFASLDTQRSPGKVLVYNQDLKNLLDIEEDSVDAIVAVSALEHNSPEGLEQVVAELIRVLKPGGKLIATLCAAPDQDRWHAPSSGWCYTDASLRRLFALSPGVPSNYSHYDELFSALLNCAELRDNLAAFYFRSGENGMPWGNWDPQYIPVGVCKIKQAGN
jgi:SAM-dependent methyltransferase